MFIELKAICKGLVQGVGFRAFVKREADGFNLKGFVKNLDDGSVEICAIGKKEILQKFIEILKKKFNAQLYEISIEYRKTQKKYDGFNIEF